MSVLQGVFLGLLQGIAEFLPISSSGHLAVAQRLFSLDDVPLVFDVMLHLATLVAVVIFFWRKIRELLCVFGRWVCRRSKPEDSGGLSMIAALVLGTTVTGVFGLVFCGLIPDMPVKAVCAGFVVTAGLLVLSGWLSRRREQKNGAEAHDVRTESAPPAPSAGVVRPVQGLLVGLAQGLGVLPGISRSGSTIAGALLCGVDRNTAGEFSFLLSIPAILGAFVLEAKDLGRMEAAVGAVPLAAGCAAAFVSGFFALSVLMRIIRKGRLEWFAAYLVPAGILGMIFL